MPPAEAAECGTSLVRENPPDKLLEAAEDMLPYFLPPVCKPSNASVIYSASCGSFVTLKAVEKPAQLIVRELK